MAKTAPVSVVIPTYNRAAYLGEAINSALAQDETGEVIVVDDGSTDSTSGVLAQFSDVRVFRTDNAERGAARNLGAANASYDFIAFLDSDDAWEPGKLAAQLRTDAPSVTGVRFIDADSVPTPRTYVASAADWSILPFENRFLAAPSSLLIRKSLFEASGGFPEDRDVQGSEDWVFLNRLRRVISRIEIIPALLTRYRVHPGNSTGQLDNVARCMWTAADLIGGSTGSSGLSRRVKGRTAGTIARQYARVGDWRSARRWSMTALKEGTPREALWTTWAVATSGTKGALDRGGRG